MWWMDWKHTQYIYMYLSHPNWTRFSWFSFSKQLWDEDLKFPDAMWCRKLQIKKFLKVATEIEICELINPTFQNRDHSSF